MSNMKIGWSEISITPDKKVSLYGQFAERISEYVEKPLMATAMAVESCGDQMILVSCDLVGVADNVVEAVRARLTETGAEKKGMDVSKIICFATHTHTGPNFTRRASRVVSLSADNKVLLESMLPEGKKYVEAASAKTDPDVATNQEVFDLLTDRLSGVCTEAWENREEASFTNAFDRACVGMCRRVAYSDGTAQMWGDANTAVFTELEGGNDSGVELMFTYAGGRMTGVVVNLACPAQCVQHRHFVSPDFWGEARKLIKERFGEDFHVLAVCGPAGDQCPVDLVRWVNPDTDVNDPNLIRHEPPVRKADPSMFDLEGMKKAGKRVAQAVFDACEDGPDAPQTEICFAHKVIPMELPLRRATLKEAAAAEKEIREYLRNKEGDVDFRDAAKLQPYMGILKRIKVQETVDTLTEEIHVIRMGSVAFATSPFELYLDYANQIKARMNCEQAFLIQLANGCEGYLPTEKGERHGHYSGFIASGVVGHEGGDLLVRRTLKEINSLFEDDYRVYTYAEEK